MKLECKNALSGARCNYWAWIGASVAVLGTVGVVKLVLRRKREKKRQSYPKDVVILHQFPAGKSVPSLSPFAMKLETWLRMADIKYENEIVLFGRSSKGQVPWITLNGVDVADSQFCIEYLTKVYGKDLSDHLSQVEKAIARGFFMMVEESLKWIIGLHRFKYGKPQEAGIPTLIFLFFKRKYAKASMIQGYGRHTKDEVYDIGRGDLKALDDFLGPKKFLFGDLPCVEDAVIFAFVTQIMYHDQGPLNEFLTTKCLNLVRHLNTIKDQYWPDWNDRISAKA